MSDDFDFDRDFFEDFDDDDDLDNVIGDDDFGNGDFDDFGDDDFGNDDFDDFGDDDFDDFDEDGFGDRLDFLDDDEDDFGDDGAAPVIVEEKDNTVRNFLLAMFVFLIIISLGFGGFFFWRESQDNAEQIAFQASSTAIAEANETRVAQIEASSTAAAENQTATMAAVDAATQTAEANEEETAQAEIAGSATAFVVNQTETQEALAQATIDAAATSQQATADADAEFEDSATQTAIAVEQTLNPPPVTEFEGNPFITFNGVPVLTTSGNPIVVIEGLTFAIINNEAVGVSPGETFVAADGTAITIIDGEPVASDDEGQPMPTVDGNVSLDAVQQTATALADLFGATSTPSDLGPTVDPNLGTGNGGSATSPAISTQIVDSGNDNDALPDTGLFDDVFGGNPMSVVLLAFALLAVIIVSRGIRGANRSET